MSAPDFTEDGWLKTGDKGMLGRRPAPSEDHRPREGPVQDEQGKVRRAGADRGPARDPPAVEACVVTGANLGQPLGIVMLTPDAAASANAAQIGEKHLRSTPRSRST